MIKTLTNVLRLDREKFTLLRKVQDMRNLIVRTTELAMKNTIGE